MKKKYSPHDIDIDPSFYPQIIVGLKQAQEDRKNGVKGYTIEEVDARLKKTIEDEEKRQKIKA